MAAGGGARAWQFLKRNGPYAEACRALTDPEPVFLDAPLSDPPADRGRPRGGPLWY